MGPSAALYSVHVSFFEFLTMVFEVKNDVSVELLAALLLLAVFLQDGMGLIGVHIQHTFFN